MQFIHWLLFLVVLSLPSMAGVDSDGQKSFDTLKTLAGSWQATLTTVPPQAEVEGRQAQVWLRVTSMGNALIHEMKIEGRKDDPITMFYLDGDRLLLTLCYTVIHNYNTMAHVKLFLQKRRPLTASC
jgi:hypothetical protein